MKFDKSKVYTALNADEVKVGSKGCFADNIEDLKERVRSNYFYTLINVGNENNAYRFKSDETVGYFLFYLAEEPDEPKEVTVAEWNNRPRIMKVWDDDYSKAQEYKVLDIRHMSCWACPVVAIDEVGNIETFRHCAEIAAIKEVEPAKEPEAEKHYRPYSNADEFIEDYKRRFCPDFKGIPAIWVKNAAGTLKQVVSITDEGVKVNGRIDYLSFLDTYTYPDGSPCGMEE